MLPGERSNDHNRNDSSRLQNGLDVYEEVDEDLVEIVRSYERKKEEEALEVRVLVIKPGNNQRLLTCDVPLRCDERDILMKVHKLFADRKYYVNMYTVNAPTFGFNYIVEYYENENGEDIDSRIHDCLLQNCQITTREEIDVLDDDVVEVPRTEANHLTDNDEIEEIRADDEVFIEKVILKEDLSDNIMEEVPGTEEVIYEEMEVEVKQIEEDQREEMRTTIQKCVAEIEDKRSVAEYLAQMNESANKSVEFLDVVQMEEGDIEMLRDKRFDKGVTETERERKMEEDKPSFEEVTESESEKEMKVGKPSFEELTGSESEKEMEEDRPSFEVGEIASQKEVEGVKTVFEETESENEMEKGEKVETDVETVCIADDTLGDDENENSSQTSGDKTVLFIYPMSRGGITVTRDDYECLNEGQYLNDIIIDFYLNYLMQEVLSQKDRERTHLFSSHFYTRLTKRISDEDSSLSLDERRYVGVQRWTKDVDIFQKDFIIVPINEHSHWFLAVICFPKLVDFVGWGDSDCEIDGIESQKPCIMIFDSLGASKKTRIAVTLRGYLGHEYMAKRNEKKNFSCSNLKTVYPKLPYQQNTTDCGLYLLQYVENFFKDPLLDYTLPIKDLSDWFSPTVIERKRERIAKIIANLAVKHNKGKTVKLPMLKLPKPDLLASLAKASSSLQSKGSVTSYSRTKERVKTKKKINAKRSAVNKRLKRLFDTDSDSDSDTTSRPSSTSRPKLRVSSHNPQPLRRSAFAPRTQIPKFYPLDESDESPSPTKATTAVPTSFLKRDAGPERSTDRKLVRTYQGPASKSSWKSFSDLTESKKEYEKLDVYKNGAGISTDRFYNLSLEALCKSPTIPPGMRFSLYKNKKNPDSQI